MTQYRALIVDDSPTMRQLLTFAIRRLNNLTFEEATDGADALAKLEAERFDIILLDLNMPRLNGVETLKALQENPSLKEIPVVMITTEADDKDRLLSLGAKAFLGKPVQAKAVVETLKSLLPDAG